MILIFTIEPCMGARSNSFQIPDTGKTPLFGNQWGGLGEISTRLGQNPTGPLSQCLAKDSSIIAGSGHPLLLQKTPSSEILEFFKKVRSSLKQPGKKGRFNYYACQNNGWPPFCYICP
ncbi:hypothetical protein [Desulfobacula sp.]|uniref:hypothetical protein n=1 Tax=Desulfobacula sp. TaxID=2593537 RepID=UPI002617A727|nr:hypothetical protein [Desulfobacula sp.]